MTEVHFDGLQDWVTAVITGASDVVIAAPFIKKGPLQALIDAAPAANFRVFTRWRPEEVARGVSDLEVFDVLTERGFGLSLVEPLHAKYYRSDATVLFGSANLTRAGLGYPQGNLELLSSAEFDDAFAAFEVELDVMSYPATEDLRAEIEAVAESLAPPAQREPTTRGSWIPQTRDPADMWKAYRGEFDRLSTASQEAAKQDLEHLDLPPGLDKQAFQAVLRTRLYSSELIRRIDVFAERSRRFGEMREFLSEQPELGPDTDPSHTWQTLFRWLLYFAPTRYRSWKVNYSELFQLRMREDASES